MSFWNRKRDAAIPEHEPLELLIDETADLFGDGPGVGNGAQAYAEEEDEDEPEDGRLLDAHGHEWTVEPHGTPLQREVVMDDMDPDGTYVRATQRKGAMSHNFVFEVGRARELGRAFLDSADEAEGIEPLRRMERALGVSESDSIVTRAVRTERLNELNWVRKVLEDCPTQGAFRARLSQRIQEVERGEV